jgi:DNA adenine methylase
VKPLISYYGGKQRIARRINEIASQIPHRTYTEPFAGGAAVLFFKDLPQPKRLGDYQEAINDKSNLITTLYRVARSQPEELQRRIELTAYSQEEHREACRICKEGGESDLELAWAVYVNANMSFAHKLYGGWGTSISGGNQAAGWANRVDRLPEVLARLKRVNIGSEDALRFIDRWDSPQTLHYCDPPYPETCQGHYGGYSMADFEALIEKLKTCQGSFILSNYPTNLKIPKGWKKLEIATTMSASGKGKTRNSGGDRLQKVSKEAMGETSRTEVLWYADRSANIRPDLAPAAWANIGKVMPHAV